MHIGKNKYKLMHVGENNPCFEYQIQRHELRGVRRQKYLGVIISNTLKERITALSKKANIVVGLFSNDFN